MLKEAEGEILDNEELIETLKKSKIDSIEIQEKLHKQQKIEESFSNARNQFREVGKRVSNLYFVILDLSMVEPTYQWSLESYVELFIQSIAKSRERGQQNRNINIIETTQINLYESTCRALLEKDKLIFSFLVYIKIMESEGQILPSETRFLMVGGTWTEPGKNQNENSKKWLSHKAWCTICEFSQLLACFKGFDSDFENYAPQWKELFDCDNPHEREFPGQW